MIKRTIALSITIVALTCITIAERSDTVTVYGALRRMFHDNDLSPRIALADLDSTEHLYALGALAHLSGEITIFSGQAYLAYPASPGTVRVEAASESDAAATLLVTAHITEWTTHTLIDDIPYDHLDDSIAALAADLGIDTAMAFPFLIEGPVADVEWHVVDGNKLGGAGSSHERHKKAALRGFRELTPARILGFYSESHQGVFTHMGSRTHLHCIVEDPLESGHVDRVRILKGTRIRFPRIFPSAQSNIRPKQPANPVTAPAEAYGKSGIGPGSAHSTPVFAAAHPGR